MKSKQSLALALVFGLTAVGGSAQEAPYSSFPDSFSSGPDRGSFHGGFVSRTAGYETDRGRFFLPEHADRKHEAATPGKLTLFQRIGRLFRSGQADNHDGSRTTLAADNGRDKAATQRKSDRIRVERIGYVFAPSLDDMRSAAGLDRGGASKADRLARRQDDRGARLARVETRRDTVRHEQRRERAPGGGRDERDMANLAQRMGPDRGSVLKAMFANLSVNRPVTSDRKYGHLVERYARAYGVPAELAHAVITVESNYRENARGRAGEVGLMQIKPATARMMGYSGSTSELYDPENNIKYGMLYLAKAHKLGGGSTCGTILKYNAGHAARRMNPISARYCAKVKRHLQGT